MTCKIDEKPAASSIQTIYQTACLGAGKTTLLRRISEHYRQQTNRIPCCGFYTEEVRGARGSRIGFDVVTLDGASRSPLARTE